MMRGVSRLFHAIGPEVVKVASERMFKEAVRDICQAFTVEHLEALAQRQIPLAQVLKESGQKLETPAELPPGAEYLLSLSDQRIFELITEAAPEHGKVLQRYPDYAKGVAQAFRAMVLGGE